MDDPESSSAPSATTSTTTPTVDAASAAEADTAATTASPSTSTSTSTNIITTLCNYKQIIKQTLSDSLSDISRRRRGSSIPIPLPISLNIINVHPVYKRLPEILNRTMLNIYAVDKALLQYKLSPPNSNNKNNVSNSTSRPSERQTFESRLSIEHITDAEIVEKINVLFSLRRSLAAFTSQLYKEIDNFGKTACTEDLLPSFLVTIYDCFVKLQASIFDIGAENVLFDKPLDYAELRTKDSKARDERWTDANTKDGVTLIDDTLNKLDVYISMMVSKYRKPGKITQHLTQHWIRYTFGAIGISLFSVWLIRHSRLSGIIDNWLLEAKYMFSEDQTLTAARDEALENLRNRHKEEMEQVQLTSDLLHSSLLDFIEQGEKAPLNVSDHEMLKMATNRFEEQLRLPIPNYISGELPRLMLIQILKRTLDIETSMCELHREMLMDSERSCSVIASMPKIFISLGFLMLARAWVKQTKAKGRTARVQRRLLIKELYERIMEFQDLLPNEDGHHINGLVLYTLDRLYRAVKRHAEASGEWQWVRYDITVLADPCLETLYKFPVISRLNEIYQCLLPLDRQELIRCMMGVSVPGN